MARETYLQLRTAATPNEVKAALLQDSALADLNLREYPDGRLGGGGVNVLVDPWDADPDDGDHFAIDGGFQAADLMVGIIYNFGTYDERCRVVASLLRLVPGDVCLADQDDPGPELLRLDGTVYVDPEGYRTEDLTGFGYAPERLVVGVPPGLASKATAAAAAS